MYGLRHKYIRIEAQQLNLKIDKMPDIQINKDNLFLINMFLEKSLLRNVNNLENANLSFISYLVFRIDYLNN